MPRILLIAGLLLYLIPLPSRADDLENSGVLVHIRVVHALEKVEVDTSQVKNASTLADENPRVVNVDARIHDLAGKLQKLHFRTFRLVSSQREVIPFGRRETLNLIDGNQLTVRPLALDDKRVSMWIKWQDPSGMKVLDTRMHFDVGESVVTGVDTAADSGLILALEVTPIEHHLPVIQQVGAGAKSCSADTH